MSRLGITPGQHADSRQAKGLVAGLEGAGDVIAGSGYGTEALAVNWSPFRLDTLA